MNRYKLTKAGVDVNQALKRLDNDKLFYETLLEKFCEDVNYELLKKAMEQGEQKQAFQYAHALKGTAGNLSFVRLYTALVPFVDDLRNGDMDHAADLFKEVAESYDILMEALKGNS